MSNLYLERYSPKGSCHLDESSMNHTLAQKHLIELLMWNASYVQKNPVKPDRSSWMTRNEKLCGNLSMSSLEESNCSDAARSSSIDIGNSDCENRAKREIENQVVLKRQGVSWVSHVPSRGKCRYVFTPILSGLRWPEQTVLGSWPPA